MSHTSDISHACFVTLQVNNFLQADCLCTFESHPCVYDGLYDLSISPKYQASLPDCNSETFAPGAAWAIGSRAFAQSACATVQVYADSAQHASLMLHTKLSLPAFGMKVTEVGMLSQH